MRALQLGYRFANRQLQLDEVRVKGRPTSRLATEHQARADAQSRYRRGCAILSERVLADDICHRILLTEWHPDGRSQQQLLDLRDRYIDHVAAVFGAGDVGVWELAYLFETDDATIRSWLGPSLLLNVGDHGALHAAPDVV